MTRCCPHCGAKYATREPLCARCGQKLYGLGTSGPDCRVCTAPNPTGATYCVGCGWRLAVEPPAPARAPGAEPLGSTAPRPTPSETSFTKGESISAAATGPVRARRTRTLAPAEPIASTSGRGWSGGCLGVAAALALALAGAVFASGHIPHSSGLLPTTWRVESAAQLEKQAGDLSTDAFAGSAVAARGAKQGFDLPLTSGAERREASGGDKGAPSRTGSPSASNEAIGRRAVSPTVAREAGSTGGAKQDGVAQVGTGVEASAGSGARTAAKGGAYAFTLRDVKTQPVVLGRWRLEMQATLENVGGAPLPYDSMATRLVTVDGVEHLPSQSGETGAMGILPAGQSATFAVAFVVPADAEAKMLTYEGVRVELIR